VEPGNLHSAASKRKSLKKQKERVHYLTHNAQLAFLKKARTATSNDAFIGAEVVCEKHVRSWDRGNPEHGKH
jgi:hypothetical protein